MKNLNEIRDLIGELFDEIETVEYLQFRIDGDSDIEETLIMELIGHEKYSAELTVKILKLMKGCIKHDKKLKKRLKK